MKTPRRKAKPKTVEGQVATRPKTVDEYLATVNRDKRAALERLRKAIRSAAPGAEECISYGIPAFRLEGKVVVWFGAAANHCAFYPGGAVQGHREELAGFDIGKGTIRFSPDRPLPVSLVRKLVKERIAKKLAR